MVLDSVCYVAPPIILYYTVVGVQGLWLRYNLLMNLCDNTGAQEHLIWGYIGGVEVASCMYNVVYFSMKSLDWKNMVLIAVLISV